MKLILERQRQHGESIDAKASIILGFTAFLLGAAVTGDRATSSLAFQMAVGFAAASFASALVSFRIRSFASPANPRSLYEEYATAISEQTLLVLCNLAADAYDRNQPHLTSKVTWLKVSIYALSGAVSAALIHFAGSQT